MHQATVLRLVPREELTYEDRMEDLRGIVWNSVKELNLSWRQLAEATNLNFATVSRFASGETKRPSSHTVDALADAVGLEVRYIRKGSRTQPDEVNGRLMRSSIPRQSKYALKRAIRRAYRRRG